MVRRPSRRVEGGQEALPVGQEALSEGREWSAGPQG